MNSYLAIGGAVITALIAAPYVLPSSKTVERTATIAAPAEEVYPLLASSKGFQTFNPYKAKDPNLNIVFSGPQEGVGASFAFDGKDGKGTQTIIAMEENRSVTMEIDLGPMGKPVTTFTLEPKGDATAVTWSTKSDFGMNPIGRVFGLFLDGMLGSDYEQGLALLDQAARNKQA
ncbi:MAG: SRPBCC family protein [Pseudomonadota bacterium]